MKTSDETARVHGRARAALFFARANKPLTRQGGSYIITISGSQKNAGIAQLVEQLTCNDELTRPIGGHKAPRAKAFANFCFACFPRLVFIWCLYPRKSPVFHQL